jgi:hypothetical protein
MQCTLFNLPPLPQKKEETIVVPVKLRPHLIPFFYQEFKEEVAAHYLQHKVKACKLSATSSLGKIIRITLEKSKQPIKPQKYYVYFSIPTKISKCTAQVYVTEKGKTSFLKVPEKVALHINEIFEDLFRYTFVTRINNVLKYAPDLKLDNLILDFMKEYDLEEFGFRLDSMRHLYHREKKKAFFLSRFQSQCSNRVYNYK